MKFTVTDSVQAVIVGIEDVDTSSITTSTDPGISSQPFSGWMTIKASSPCLKTIDSTGHYTRDYCQRLLDAIATAVTGDEYKG